MMTPEQALSILDQATAALSMPREGHRQVAEALDILTEIVRSPKAEVELPPAISEVILPNSS